MALNLIDRERILVTGGAGFLGSHICERLLDEGNYVLCLDNYFTGQKQNIFHLMNNKHFEVIIRRMLAKVQVLSPGDTELLPGDLVDRRRFAEINDQVTSQGKEPASAKPVLLGITKAALNTDSFLSASSFQHTIKVLSRAAVEGKRDELKGLKENLSGEDVREGLVGVVSVKIPEPQFEGQTKTKLGNSEVKGLVETFVNDKLGTFFEENPQIARKIIAKVVEAARAREAARKAKELTRRKGFLEGDTLPGKLADCRKGIRLEANSILLKATQLGDRRSREETGSIKRYYQYGERY